MGREFEIVPATPEMVDDLHQLEEACFSAPWTRKMLQAELRDNKFAHFLVAMVRQERDPVCTIVGYHCFWIVFDELRLMNLAVQDSMRRRGVGRALVSEALALGLSQGATRAVLEVRTSNSAALSLYGQLGFLPFSTRRQYYSNPVEDAVLMELDPLVLPVSSGRVRVSTAERGFK